MGAAADVDGNDAGDGTVIDVDDGTFEGVSGAYFHVGIPQV